MWAKIKFKLLGWKTIIWSDFLIAVGLLTGLLLPVLDAFDVTSIGALIPQKFAPFAPLVIALIGQVTKMLRKVTTGPVGSKGDETPPQNVKAGD